jgi:hypothetical protein
MLKLEKNRHQIAVTIRKFPGRFGDTFLKALAIAFALHLAAFLLFQVHRLLHVQSTILPFTLVETDLSSSENESGQGLQISPATIRAQKYTYRPTVSFPSIPQWEFHLLEDEVDWIKEEKNSYVLEMEEPWIDQQETLYPPFVFHITGPLGEIPLVTEIEELNTFIQQSKMPFRQNVESVIYTVRMEHKTGRIFWFKLRQGAQTAQVNALAEMLLKMLRFQTLSSGFVSSGEVEFHFH